jgi:hypothetical protein
MYSNSRPHWWQLYLTFPLLIGLFVADSRLKLTMFGHQVVQIGIIVFVYWVIRRWLKANEGALSHMDQQEYSPTFRVIRYPVYSSEESKQPLIQLPDSEVKGVLGNTFDVDYIDVKALPVEEVSKK